MQYECVDRYCLLVPQLHCARSSSKRCKAVQCLFRSVCILNVVLLSCILGPQCCCALLVVGVLCMLTYDIPRTQPTSRHCCGRLAVAAGCYICGIQRHTATPTKQQRSSTTINISGQQHDTQPQRLDDCAQQLCLPHQHKPADRSTFEQHDRKHKHERATKRATRANK